MEYLLQHGIQTLIHYPIPPHQQQAYKNLNYKKYPISEGIHEEVLSLPIGPRLELEEVKKIVNHVNEFSGC